MTLLQKTLLAIFIMVSLLPVTIAQPNIVIGETHGGSVNSFEFSVANTGTTSAYVAPVVYYWSGSSWVMVQNAKAGWGAKTVYPTALGGGFSYILVNPGDRYVISTQQVIPSGNQWIAWNAWIWDGTKWNLLDPNWSGKWQEYKIS
jgi:hypothetical protein